MATLPRVGNAIADIGARVSALATKIARQSATSTVEARVGSGDSIYYRSSGLYRVNSSYRGT